MKLHLHTDAVQNLITGHGPGYVDVSGSRITNALIVSPTELISPWQAPAVADLSFADFEAVVAMKPALVVFGSGATFAFPHPKVLAAFSQARIGFEVMDTGAACRTYNVLMSEGRNVVAALIV